MNFKLHPQTVETRTDRHGNDCEIIEWKDKWMDKVYKVRYVGSKRFWPNRKTGMYYFSNLVSARNKIRNN